jgi:hypothetical protein
MMSKLVQAHSIQWRKLLTFASLPDERVRLPRRRLPDPVGLSGRALVPEPQAQIMRQRVVLGNANDGLGPLGPGAAVKLLAQMSGRRKRGLYLKLYCQRRSLPRLCET